MGLCENSSVKLWAEIICETSTEGSAVYGEGCVSSTEKHCSTFILKRISFDSSNMKLNRVTGQILTLMNVSVSGDLKKTNLLWILVSHLSYKIKCLFTTSGAKSFPPFMSMFYAYSIWLTCKWSCSIISSLWHKGVIFLLGHWYGNPKRTQFTHLFFYSIIARSWIIMLLC